MGAALSAFLVVFAAEFGDRTQLLVLALATRHRPLPIVAGLVGGYAVTNALAVAVGGLLGAALPERALQLGSGLLFLAFAVWVVLDADDEDDAVHEHVEAHPVRLALTTAGAVIVSEIGDKSMLATAVLASDAPPLAVWAGATGGVVTAGVIGIAAGRWLGAHVDPRWIRWAGAGVFAVVGVVLLLGAG